jgi:hypothetical protein
MWMTALPVPAFWPSMGPMDWFFVGLASAIIWLILGGKMWRDIQGWLKGPTP